MKNDKTHIISHGKKWAVVKSKAKRATKLFDFREQAYHFAMQISNNVIVHNSDGTVLFKTIENTISGFDYLSKKYISSMFDKLDKEMLKPYGTINKISRILYSTKQINMSNYTNTDVANQANALNEIFKLIEPFKE